MPAESKSQQRLFGMALAYKEGKSGFASKKVKDIAKKMSKKEIKKFAKTKHKGLNEKYALSFNQFINEAAYVDQEGQLQDFNLDQNELNKMEYDENVKQFVNNTTQFLEDHEATDVYIRIKGPLMHIAFEFYGQEYGIVSDIDTGRTELARLDKTLKMGAQHLGNFSDYGILIDLIKAQGLYFLNNLE